MSSEHRLAGSRPVPPKKTAAPSDWDGRQTNARATSWRETRGHRPAERSRSGPCHEGVAERLGIPGRVRWKDRRSTTEAAADRAPARERCRRRPQRRRRLTASRRSWVRTWSAWGGGGARPISRCTLRFPPRGLARRPSGSGRLGGGRALGEVRATRGAAGSRGSHQPCWRPWPHAAGACSTYRCPASRRTDRRSRRSSRCTCRPGVEVLGSDSRTMARGPDQRGRSPLT